MARWAAFVLFALCAFNVSVPWLDRAGTAALALGFTALSVGRFAWASRPAPSLVAPPARMTLPPRPDTLTAERLDALADY